MRMKQVFLTILLLWGGECIYAQVGINTLNPKGVFHVHTGSQPNNLSNDIIVSESGNLGVGVESPQYKLDINTGGIGAGFALIDGNQGSGKVLTSDAQGNGTWIKQGLRYTTIAKVPEQHEFIKEAIKVSTGYVAYTGMSIKLLPGNYAINFSLWITLAGNIDTSRGNSFVSLFLSTSSTEVVNLSSYYISPIKSIILNPLFLNHTYNVANSSIPSYDFYGSGVIPINIPENNDSYTTLYLWAFTNPTSFISSGATKQIISRLRVGTYGPYTQLYAVPFDL